ncbi:hypothetical protein O3M35_009969 [Rhynocoris fuscipes]|uniref:SOCS box domain-containing protein n=1 Tax=Rhynocoris fuscipes TaxID=488301 RepID=A0AAW1D0F3_9HEMI
MDTIMQCYFDEVFTGLDRSFLFAKYKRKELVDYLSNVIQGCSNVDDNNPKEVCETAVRCALDFHRTTKGNNGQVCLMGKYHNVLYVVAKLAFDWKVDDSETIADLLNSMYQCERTFDRLITGAIFGPKASGIISGWKSDFHTREENIKAIVYFLDHATKAKCVYKIRGVQTRLVDVPMESYAQSTPAAVSVQVCCADILLVLLQYGAKVYVEGLPCAMEVLVRKLSEQADCINPNLEQCCKVMMRTIAYVPKPDLDEESPYNIGYKLLPCRRTTNVAELKHLCRLQIRQCLYDNFQLPHGIYVLPLPDEMKQFINLEMD